MSSSLVCQWGHASEHRSADCCHMKSILCMSMVLSREHRIAVSCASMQDIAHHDFAFEDIINDSEQQLKTLAEALGLSRKVQHHGNLAVLPASSLRMHCLRRPQ